MNAAQFNTRIVIKQRGAGVDAIGQPLPDSWDTFATLWANVRHTSGAEAIKANTLTSIVKASIRVRWIAGITAGMRVWVDAVVYEIGAVMPDLSRHEFIDLVCEVVA